MKFVLVIKQLALLLARRKRRLASNEGYSMLIKLGWPTSIINDKMCNRAEAGLMRRYVGVQSWIAYKEEWEWVASANLGEAKILNKKSEELEASKVVELSVADHPRTS